MGRTFFLFAVLVLVTFSVPAQSPQASISGTVTDAQSALVPRVSVSAINADTGVKTTAHTNEAGFYSLQALAVGPYSIRVERDGFQTQVQSGIVLTTGQALELNFALKVGAVTETVAVTADAPLIETRSSDASQLIESKTIEDIPLGDRRALNVMELQGAAVFVSYASGERPYFSVGGGRGRSQNFIMDGGSGQTIRIGQAQVEVDPPVETLQEIKVLTNAFSAEYGGTASGVVIMNTKSGTNRLHGSLSEYFRNEKLDAANFFSPWLDGQKQRPPVRYNVFGGTLSGPIRQNKAFYFVGYEGSRRRDGITSVMTVPSALERAGDYSQTFNANGTLAVIYDPNTGTPSSRTAFPGNKIPADRLDPVALNVIKAYPLPNRTPDNVAGSNNFSASSVNVLDRDNVSAKGDYNLKDAYRLSGRFLWNRQDTSARSVYADPGADPTGSRSNRGWNLLGSWTSIIRPTLINEFRGGWVTRTTLLFVQSVGLHYPSKLGLQGIPDDAFPRFSVTGYTALGSNNQRRDQTPIQQGQLSDTMSWIKGTHSIRFGGDARRSRNQDLRLQQASGAFTFNKAITGLTGKNTTGNGAAALLLGYPSNFQAARPPVIDRSSWYLAGFVQDDWQIRRDLVINIGLRWEVDTPFKTRNNILNGFDGKAINPVSGTPGVVKFAGVNGFPTSPHDMDWNNFGPRVGFAWRPFGSTKTVIRSAYGIFYAAPYDGGDATTSVALGFGDSLVIPTGQDGTTISFRLRDPIPVRTVHSTLDDSYGAVPVGTQTSTAVTFYERRRPTGYSQQMNFTLQRELTGSMMAQVGYMGNLSRKMPSDPLSINQVPPQLLTPGNNQVRRPFPQFSDVQIQAPPLGVMSYHALVARAQKRFSGGFSLLATYTCAKALGNTTSIQALGNDVSEYSNFYNRRADYGPTDNDIRHRITWSSIYQIPYGRGRRFGNRSVAGAILGDWSVSSVLIWQTAPPFTVTTATNTTQAFSAGPLRADVIRNPNLSSSQRSLTRWFDTDAFAQPAVNQFGNQGVNILRGARRSSLNASILRDFQLRENLRLQFRGEAFNLLNHANFGLPGQTFGNADFGVVNSAADPRRMQLGVRCVF
jgi:hypothetical protein